MHTVTCTVLQRAVTHTHEHPAIVQKALQSTVKLIAVNIRSKVNVPTILLIICYHHHGPQPFYMRPPRNSKVFSRIAGTCRAYSNTRASRIGYNRVL